MTNDEAQIQLKKRIFESLDTGNLGERPYGSWILTHLYTLSPEAQLLPQAFSMSHLLRQPMPCQRFGIGSCVRRFHGEASRRIEGSSMHPSQDVWFAGSITGPEH